MSTFHLQSVGCKPNLAYQSRSKLRGIQPRKIKILSSDQSQTRIAKNILHGLKY